MTGMTGPSLRPCFCICRKVIPLNSTLITHALLPASMSMVIHDIGLTSLLEWTKMIVNEMHQIL